jgi:hypothetical protein
MNAERLRGIVDFLLAAESGNGIQERLTALLGTVTELVANPADQAHQRKVAESLAALEKSASFFVRNLTPAEKRNIAEVRGNPYFSETLVAELSAAFLKNGMTPAVVQQQLKNIIKERQQYIETLRGLQTQLNTIGVESQTLLPGEAEIGILIPRELFHNDLGGFQKELKTLNSIIRTFYEVSNLTPGPVEIRQISTSDPILFLGMDITVLIHLGHTIKWCVDTIKASMDIKKIIEAARAANVEQPIIDSLENQITMKVNKCVDEKVAAILADYTGEKTRKNELKKPLHTSLEQILQRVERGMTVEIRFIPPPKPEPEAGAGDVPHPEGAKFDELQEIAKSLDFPQIPPGQPMMQLTQVDQNSN